MNLRALCAAGLMSAVVLPVWAQTPAASPPVVQAAGVSEAKATAAATENGREHHCLRETGTRIRLQGSQGRPRCNDFVSGRVWTREELDRTGQLELSQALRMLDPSIY